MVDTSDARGGPVISSLGLRSTASGGRVLDERLVTNLALLTTMAVSAFFGVWGVVGVWWGFAPGLVGAYLVPAAFTRLLRNRRARRLLIRLADNAFTPSPPPE